MKSGTCTRTTVICWQALLVTTFLLGSAAENASTNTSGHAENSFPPDMFLGVASAAYQIEGSWDTDGKGENIWDHLLHTQPNFTSDGKNADVAADSYHKYQEDLKAVSSIGANMYRISFAWSRILPSGYANIINQAGIDYYNRLIDGMIERNITPIVTMYHFDLPQELQKLGGWPNPIIADYFLDYANILFKYFGDRVKWWLTFNEPSMFANGYASSNVQAPSSNASGIGDYLTSKTVIKAHALVWHLYNDVYRAKQNGKVGMALNIDWNEPATDSEGNAQAAERALQFLVGMWMNPVYSKDGDYPKVVRERVDRNSEQEGRTRSRLPHFSREEIDYIKGTGDFIGITHYSTYQVSNETTGTIPSMTYDMGANRTNIQGYPHIDGSGLFQIVPWGIRKAVNWLKKTYPGYFIMIVENGCSDSGTLEDNQRKAFLGCYMSEVIRAINEDGVDVRSYLIWSNIDSFEWKSGYTSKFGLYQVDPDDPQLKRVAKDSVSFVKEIYDTKTVPLEYFSASTTDTNSLCFTAENGNSTSQQSSKSGHSKVRLQQQRSSQRAQRGKQQQQRRLQKQRKKSGRVAHRKS